MRKWLASTFAKQEATHRRADGEPRPSFRSVANAIRTGIFIERIYRRMSSSQLMSVPPEVAKALKVRVARGPPIGSVIQHVCIAESQRLQLRHVRLRTRVQGLAPALHGLRSPHLTWMFTQI